MYYLAQFCRICIKTDEKLLDIDSKDIDDIKLSEKLEICTKMVINKESLSTKICTTCIQKLRTSYEFQELCKQSSKKLQGYLAELLSVSKDITPEKFQNAELHVTLQPLGKILHKRKKRVSKEQRCSLLKKLLLKAKIDENSESPEEENKSNKEKDTKGGLRNLIGFTSNYDFGYKIIEYRNYDHTPLERLTEFSRNYFYVDGLNYRQQIVSVLDSVDLSDSEEEELLYILQHDGKHDTRPVLKFEEVIIEPDIKIKTECEFEDEDLESYDYSSSLVEACYEENSDAHAQVKLESPRSPEDACLRSNTTHVGHNKFLAEIIPIASTTTPLSRINGMQDKFRERYRTLCSVLNAPINNNNNNNNNNNSGPPVTELLSAMVARYSENAGKRTLSPNSIRCRTRGNPYINPQLQRQFQLRSFKCNTCNRRFKSPGYLNAHIVKLKHY